MQNLEIQFQNFLDSVWPLPPVSNPPSPTEIRDLKRKIWYCNISGIYIPELQEYNNFPVVEKMQSDDSIAARFYQKGYTAYRVYQNGQAFLDIQLASALFDYFCVPFYYPRPTKEQMQAQIERLRTDEPFEQIPNSKDRPQFFDNRLKMYLLITSYIIGTIHLRPHIPEDALLYLSDEYQKGDLVDTVGYRGRGLWIFDGTCFILPKEFDSCRIGEYVPIPSEYLELRGYCYYYRDCPITDWNIIHFPKGVVLTPYGFEQEEHSPGDDTEWIHEEDGKVFYFHLGKWIELEMVDGRWNLPFPFENAAQANAILQSEHNFRLPLPSERRKEFLLFGPHSKYEVPSTSTESYYRDGKRVEVDLTDSDRVIVGPKAAEKLTEKPKVYLTSHIFLTDDESDPTRAVDWDISKD